MKILVIQQRRVGDVLLSSMLCEQIKKNIPTSCVHYLVNTNTEAIVMNNPYIDQIIFFTEEYRKSKWSFYKFLNGLNQENYDVVIDAYCKLESMLVTLFSKAKVKISIDKWYSKSIYTETCKYTKVNNSNLGLAVENRLKLLKPLLNDKAKVVSQPKVYLTENEILKARLFLENSNIDFSNPILMINILGSAIQKTYPLTYMAQIIDYIVSKGEFTLLFNYIPSQLNQAKELYNLCSLKSRSKIKFDVYTSSLRSFLGVLYHCNALIGNEGGAVNMAKALNIPTFSIFSPWIDKATWETFKHIKSHVAVHLNDYKPKLFTGKSRKKLKKNAPDLYCKFKPILFKEKINHFLESEVLIKKRYSSYKNIETTTDRVKYKVFNSVLQH
ncbi:glycosyltransferase family 9 protein [Geojedonia litorea]|uniref:Glycosyltransferase family 9 protein n=1 Tax=Geojedonia litorea TaxID=1268269 RepID=A0ABV9N7D3_9FLAO